MDILSHFCVIDISRTDVAVAPPPPPPPPPPFRAWIDLIPAWISNLSNYIYDNLRNEITYLFWNVNVEITVEFWEWVSDFTIHFTSHVITYPYSDWS